jgi:hypothetical protein
VGNNLERQNRPFLRFTVAFEGKCDKMGKNSPSQRHCTFSYRREFSTKISKCDTLVPTDL